MVLPEILLQRDQLPLVVHIPVDAADNGLVLAVVVETAVVKPGLGSSRPCSAVPAPRSTGGAISSPLYHHLSLAF